MPTKRTRAARQRKATAIDPAVLAALLEEPVPEGANPFTKHNRAMLGQALRDHKDEILALWAARHPNDRPPGWWRNVA